MKKTMADVDRILSNAQTSDRLMMALITLAPVGALCAYPKEERTFRIAGHSIFWGVNGKKTAVRESDGATLDFSECDLASIEVSEMVIEKDAPFMLSSDYSCHSLQTIDRKKEKKS